MVEATDTLRGRLLEKIRERWDDAMRTKHGPGGLGIYALVELTRAVDPDLCAELEAIVNEAMGGESAPMYKLAGMLALEPGFVAEALGKGELEKLCAEHGVDLEAFFADLEPVDPEREAHRRRVEARDYVTMPWEAVEDGVELDVPPLAAIVDTDRSVAAAATAVADWIGGPGKPILVIAGVPGCGKTHLLRAAAAAIKVRGAPVLYRTEGNFLGTMAGATFEGAEALMVALCSVPALVYDDLGNYASTPNDLRRLDRLIDARYGAKLPTLFSTNLTGAGLHEKLPRSKSRLSDVQKSVQIQITAGDGRLVDWDARRRAAGGKR